MTSPNNTTNITPPRVPLIDERTGLISREWYRFFLNLFTLTGSGTNQTSLVDLQLGPPSPQQEDIIDIVIDVETAKIQPTQESATEQIAELAKQVEALAVMPLTSWVLSELAELQSQIDGLSATSVPPVNFLTNGSSILYGDNLGGFSNVTIGSGISFSGGTLSATGSGGTVTAVTGVAPITSTGGTTPAIGVTAAALTEVDDTNVTLTLGGSPSTALLAATSLTLGWTGQLATSRGGTGLASYTANQVFYASSTSAIGQSANLTFNGTTLTANDITDSSLTSGRVTYAGTGGNLIDSANLTFNGTTLTTTGINNTGNTTLGDASTDTVTVNGYMGVGTVNAANLFRLTGSGGFSGTTQVGVSSLPTGTSVGTSSLSAVVGGVTSATASYTITNAQALFALDATKGAGSTITNQHGVYIADQTQGTNNFGITSLVSSGTNKWNIYASGTAANYFAGNVSIGTTTVGSPLNVVGAAGYVATLDGATDTRLDFKNSGTRNGIIATTSSAFQFTAPTAIPMLFLTNNTNRMRIDSAGFTQFNSNLVMPYQGAPTSKAAAATLTGAELITGILNTTGTTYTITLPTGTDIEGALTWSSNNVTLDWWVINTASGTITIAANGNTTLGGLTIATGVSAQFRIRRTAANTFTVYRLG